MDIRPEAPAEYARVEQIHTLAFGGPNAASFRGASREASFRGASREARVVAGVRQSPHYIPQLSLVAVLDGQIAGHILFSYVGLEAYFSGESRANAE
ncbi:MAG TPA: hypothetical protein VFS50_01220 [Meiothermus sp.]|jgi:putative acetyltransferase|nr:hypothetical protein [Meiothermus sp.]